MNRVHIPNERLWEIAQHGEDIDRWLADNVGPGNWLEHFGFTALPYRSFSFKDTKDEIVFKLRWL